MAYIRSMRRGVYVWLNVVTCLAVAACASQEASQGPSESEGQLASRAPVPTDDDLIDNDVVAYAAKCKAELGITTPLPDLSCTDGQLTAGTWDASRRVEVPITVDGVPVNEQNFRFAIDKGCDRSQWLESRCWTYDLVQRVDIAPDVEAILNCRQKYETNWLGVADRKAAYLAAKTPADKLATFKLAYEFNDLGYIVRNKKTGKSCFFTSYDVPFYGGFVPAPDRTSMPPRDELYAMLPEPKPPAEYDERQWNRGPKGHPELPNNMFFTPKSTAENGSCLGCHNQGAFKHSPFIDQATAPSVGRLVPTNDRRTPYLLVGRAFQNSFRNWGIAEIDTGAGGENACTMCHRMSASESGAYERVEWAVGKNVPATSTWADTWPQRAWMRPNHGQTSESDYREMLGADIDKLLCCTKNPDAKGCLKRSIGPVASDVKLAADGTLDPAGWITPAANAAVSCETAP
jgi:hypothetical protein